MASFVKSGPLWSPGSPSATSQQQQNGGRRQSWATVTWATGQSILSGMLRGKGYDVAQHYRPGEYQAFRDEILMPPAYDSIVPRRPSAPQPASQPQSPPTQMQTTTTTTATTVTPATPTAPAGPLRHQPLELPPLPRLLGVDNLDEWDDMLMRTLRLHGLAGYLSTPHPGIPEPARGTPSHERWSADRAAVCLLMVGSFSADVRDTLLAYGYDPSEEDPRAVHELVLEALPRAAGEDVSTWMRELSGIAPSDARCGGSGGGAPNLRGYCLRLQYLRRRLYQAEPQPNDNLVLVMAVLGLARCERYESLSMTLGRELERGGLSWARLMGDLSAVHGREVRERRGKKWKSVDDARS